MTAPGAGKGPRLPPAHPGLCADCVHARRVESARGSVFWLCRRSAEDAAYRKYPRLPVRECSGFVAGNQA